VRRYAAPIGAGVLVAFGAATMVRNAEYSDGVTIWQTVLDRWPHTRAHANLAMELRDHDRIDDSVRHLRIAAPFDANSEHALGSALLERGELEQGVGHLRHFVDAYPDDPHLIEAREELASGLFRQNRLPEAIVQYEAVVASAPNYAAARVRLA